MNKGKVLIDGDIIAYRAAFATQDMSPKDAEAKVDELVGYVLSETIDLPFPTEEEFEVFLTGQGNFRYDIAKSHEYKGNRKSGEKPINLPAARQRLEDKYGAVVSEGEEADDLISKRAAELGYNCVVASIDKDMLQLPCWHFNFGRGEWKQVDEFEGLKFFYGQILTGDSADNIVGLHRVGPVKAEKILKDCDTEDDLWEAVLKAYDGDLERVVENARLLWLRRRNEELWEPPVTSIDMPEH